MAGSLPLQRTLPSCISTCSYCLAASWRNIKKNADESTPPIKSKLLSVFKLEKFPDSFLAAVGSPSIIKYDSNVNVIASPHLRCVSFIVGIELPLLVTASYEPSGPLCDYPIFWGQRADVDRNICIQRVYGIDISSPPSNFFTTHVPNHFSKQNSCGLKNLAIYQRFVRSQVGKLANLVFFTYFIVETISLNLAEIKYY